MNRIILTGRLVRDPEIRYTQSGEPVAVCRFTMAVARPYKKDRQEGEAAADFINCVSFGKRGENIGQYFKKGNRINVEGRLQIDNYTDKRGVKKVAPNVIVSDFEFVDTREESVRCGNRGNDQGVNDDFFPW